MSEQQPSTAVRLSRGILAGFIAGAVASFAMDCFQAVASPLLPSDGGDEEPATQKVADVATQMALGHDVPDAAKALAGQVVHYAVGVGLGIAYGIAAEFRPAVSAGYGAAFGLGTATLLDEIAVPAVGLGDAPWTAPAATSLYGYASHFVFGTVAELVRRQVAGTLTKSSE